MSYALVCAGLMAMISEADLGTPTDTTRDYQELRAKAGRSSDEQVRLALWCEAHGMASERLNHLTLAVLADPTNTKARGLMGMVPYEGRFQRPEAVAEKVRIDPILEEYHAKRVKTPYSADGQWSLAVWAEEHGLADQAKAHFRAVTKIDSGRADAWKRLGYRKHDGRWITDADLALEKAEAEAQKQADRKWKPILEDLRRRLATPSQSSRAESNLASLNDPRSVPSILRVFGGVSMEQPRAVQLLGQIDSPASSRALAVMAVAGRSSEARRAATETLRSRDPIEYAELLISLLGEPIRFEVKHVDGLDSPGELLIEGKQANIRRVYTPPTPFKSDDRIGVNDKGEGVVFREVDPSAPADVVLGDLFGSRNFATMHALGSHVLMNPREIHDAIQLVQHEFPFQSGWTPLRIHFSQTAEIPLSRMVAEIQRSTVATAHQLRQDIRTLEDHNFAVRTANERVAAVLSAATGQALPADRRVWLGWYLVLAGYASPTPDWTLRRAMTRQVAIGYVPPALPDGSSRQVIGYEVTKIDCFAAGTPVQTIAGPRPIESLQIGDRVLTQDSKTGALGYHPVLAAHEHPSLETFRIKIAGDSIVASHFHRFWVTGRGWVIARDLKAGDRLRTLGGVIPIESIVPDATQSVYNLDVADDADFFAGNIAALVHDNSQPDPRLVPFDR